MDITNVPLIVEEQRTALKTIFDEQYKSYNTINELLQFPVGDYAHDYIYHNTFQRGVINMIRNSDGTPLMCVFSFSPRNEIKIYRELGLSASRSPVNGLRVFPHQTVAMHIDANRGEIGRNNPIYSVVVNGSDGCVYMSNKQDGTRLVAIPGLQQFVMVPTDIEHGASSGAESYDLLQIQLSTHL